MDKDANFKALRREQQTMTFPRSVVEEFYHIDLSLPDFAWLRDSETTLTAEKICQLRTFLGQILHMSLPPDILPNTTLSAPERRRVLQGLYFS